jgi:hypothetical protein
MLLTVRRLEPHELDFNTLPPSYASTQAPTSTQAPPATPTAQPAPIQLPAMQAPQAPAASAPPPVFMPAPPQSFIIISIPQPLTKCLLKSNKSDNLALTCSKQNVIHNVQIVDEHHAPEGNAF